MAEKVQQIQKAAEEETPFFSLTPTRNAQGIKAYRKAMDYALSQGDIRNIAITGPYGAGKSSFLRTYFEGRKEVVWVSLASFLGVPKKQHGASQYGSENASDDKSKDYFGEERRLELSILQQIFYRLKSEKVPCSRLCKTSSVSIGWYWHRIIWAILTILFVLGVLQPDYLVPFVSTPVRLLISKYAKVIFWVSAAGLTVSFATAAWQVLFWLKVHGIRSVDIHGLGISMSDKTERSILNRNIDEIIYHFEVSSYKTVVFEDIDRFDDVDIFTKLREVNLVLNNAEQIPAEHKPIRFIYALKEDLFVDRKDKVKFFDFIIPIVPIINASNSRDVLTKFLISAQAGSENNKAEDQDNTQKLLNIIRDISPFLSDMRLVKNICNEFTIYKGEIPDCADAVHLFGLIVFKNFFPGEFAQLHSDGGILPKLILEKKSLLQKREEEVLAAIESRKKKILEIRNEETTALEQLKLPYLGALLRHLPQNETHIRIGYNNVAIAAVAQDNEVFESLRASKVLPYSRAGKPIDWKSIENAVDPNHTFEERLELVKGKTEGTIRALQETNNKDSEFIAKLKGMSLSQLAEQGLVDKGTIRRCVSETSSEIDDEDVHLLLRLIAGGYIDEQYKYYISIFHGNEASRTRRDYFYEIDAMQGKEATIDLELDNPREVIKNLPLRVFETKAILNLSLFKELVQQKGEKYEAVIKLLATEDWDCCGFLSTFLGEEDSPLPPRMQVYRDIESANRKYVEHMLDLYWPDQSPRGTLYSLVGFYLRRYLEDGEGALNPSVKRFLEEDAKVRKVLGPAGLETPEAFTQLINKAQLCFSTVDTIKINNEALCKIADNLCAYRLDLYNIERVVGVEHREALQRANLSTIIDCGNTTLRKYVQDNFESYVDNVYDKLECQQQEKTECVLEVLNRPDLPTNTKKRFLDKQDKHFEIKNVQDIQAQDAVQLVLYGNFLSVSWENIVNAGIVLGSAEKVVSFVSAPAISDCLANMKCDLPWGRVYNVAKALAESNELADEALDKLLRQLPQGLIVDYQGTTATPLRVQLLVKSRRISFSTELYNRLKSSGTGSQTTLAALDFKEMDKALEKEEISPMDIEVVDLFNSGLLSSASERIAFLRFADQIAKEEDLAATVANHISSYNYKKLPIPVLDACVEYVTPLSLQCKIIQHLGGSADEIRERLKKMEEPYRKLGELGCHPQIRKWDGMDSFLDFLKDNNIVSSVGDGNDGRIQVHTTKT